jgi:hypothetical protein
MLQLTECWEPECTAPAEILDAYVCESTDGPVEHFRVRCLNGHYFNGVPR